MNGEKTLVARGARRYGTVSYTPGLGWIGIKAGEFETVRSGFESQAAAQTWVLTNPHPQVKPAGGVA